MEGTPRGGGDTLGMGGTLWGGRDTLGIGGDTMGMGGHPGDGGDLLEMRGHPGDRRGPLGMGGTQAGSLLSCRVKGSLPLIGPDWLLGCQLAFHPTSPSLSVWKRPLRGEVVGELSRIGACGKGANCLSLQMGKIDFFFFFWLCPALPCPALHTRIECALGPLGPADLLG